MTDEIYELEKKFIQLWEIEPVNFAITGYYYLNDKIQIKDKVYCTYINEYYGPHRVCYKLAQSTNNSNT